MFYANALRYAEVFPPSSRTSSSLPKCKYAEIFGRVRLLGLRPDQEYYMDSSSDDDMGTGLFGDDSSDDDLNNNNRKTATAKKKPQTTTEDDENLFVTMPPSDLLPRNATSPSVLCFRLRVRCCGWPSRQLVRSQREPNVQPSPAWHSTSAQSARSGYGLRPALQPA